MYFRVILLPLAIFSLHYTQDQPFHVKMQPNWVLCHEKEKRTAIRIFFFHRSLLLITKKKENFVFSLFSFAYIFLSLNEKYYIPIEREFIQEEIATKFTFLSVILFIFLMNIYISVTYCFFSPYNSIVNDQLDCDFDYTSLKYSIIVEKKRSKKWTLWLE